MITNPPAGPDDAQRHNDVRMRTLATQTSVVMWHTAPDGSAVGDNPSWEAFTGQSHAEATGWGWLAAIDPAEREVVRAAWQAGVATRALVGLRYRLRRADGQLRDVEAQAVPVLDGDELREWVGICIDVTDRKRQREELEASEERLRLLDRLSEATRSVTEATAIMAITAQMLGDYLGVTRCAYADVELDNDRFTIRSDWSAPGVPSSAGVYSLDLFGPQATDNLRNGRKLVVNDVDRELGDEGGGRMFNAIGIKAIITAPLVKDGRLVAMMAVHSAEPRRWTEREVAIVGEVVERCWAHIERVRDAALLREQDRYKDEFLATLAHELRNPLAPMRFALAMLRLSNDPAKATHAREIVERQVGHMARLVDDLLDQSRINRGLIELRRERVALATLMEQAVEAARPDIEAAGHRFMLQLPPSDLELDADPARIVQVIGNLLNNATKYTPDGGDIRLAAWRSGSTAQIEVVDNGVGIPADQQGRVFHTFTQLPHSIDRAKGGLGIGLSLVKRLVEMHGGRVAVRSDGLDAGTAFTIELPVATAPAAAGGLEPAPFAIGTATGRRILVVEDNPDGREALVALLEMLGYAVQAAADGPTALQVAARFVPQVVLLDLGLPGMDGYAVARALQADPRHADAVIVALTGWGAERDRALTRQAGFHHHLTKPVDPGVLQGFLEQIGSAPLKFASGRAAAP
ncbi:MAG: ATP-binding protein [Caldimonas sp.]